MQDGSGSPQKLGPCGNEAPQTMTNMVTPYRPGDTVTIRLTEAVFHPGHFRVALAANALSDLPAEPPVTAGSTPCGSVPINPNPTFPVLADGALQHTAPLVGEQTIQVKLPTNVTCTKCTLQVIQFMSNHSLNIPGGCFYHHCANIAIQGAPVDGGVVPSDAGSGTPRDASMTDGVAATGGAGGAPTGSGGSGGGLGTTGAGGSIGGNDPTGTTGGSTSGPVTTSTVGTGGTSSVMTSSTAATGGATGATPGNTDPGCSCTLPGQTRSSTAALTSLLLLAFALGTRRRLS
jgi:MYXO-CTERM domain-containing protein